MSKERATPNRPTELGRQLGRSLARLADKADFEQRKKFPNQVERCTSCAFRLGTIPNGCEETLMDALKCVMEGESFMCHEHKDLKQICSGWMVSQGVLLHAPKIATPWPFSHDSEGWAALAVTAEKPVTSSARATKK